VIQDFPIDLIIKALGRGMFIMWRCSGGGRFVDMSE
jgi:hypothetical protein